MGHTLPRCQGVVLPGVQWARGRLSRRSLVVFLAGSITAVSMGHIESEQKQDAIKLEVYLTYGYIMS